ncbi:sensor histidine kinase [Spongiactinospora sp. TRM90649]|uniref:sensor histidine kinase n=1 Tax=Spongiactinospora sp. TRM90649 TaxID=3031114 RepID=UPI0023F6BFAB|nr:sensor histidine kinase [Spongiactinospora sp. TRM90649]MDF5757168.1 sensor histidine kinase [Spongiactinospora sp. TRM90649]
MEFFRRPAVRVVFGVLLIAYLLFGALSGVIDVWARQGFPVGVAVAVLAAGASAVCVLALYRLSSRVALVLFPLALAGGLAMHAISPFSGLAVIFVALCAAPYRLSPWWAAVFCAADIAGTALVSVWAGVEGAAIFGISMGFGYCVVLVVLFRQLTLTRQLAESRAREAAQAERTRLAREIHDILAHAQSAQIVHLEGARLLLERGEDVPAALDRVTRAVRLARAGLEETRRAVDALRGSDLCLPDRLERLAVEHRSASGTACEVRVAGDLDDVSAGARLAVARTAQEALTNVRKHAPGASAEVSLRRVAGWCELEVRDHGGRAGDEPSGEGGYGLVGMRERAELLGGSLTAGRGEGGFRVLLRVPAVEGGAG